MVVPLVSCVITLGLYNRFTNVKCILLSTGMSEWKAALNSVTCSEGLVGGAEPPKQAETAKFQFFMPLRGTNFFSRHLPEPPDRFFFLQFKSSEVS